MPTSEASSVTERGERRSVVRISSRDGTARAWRVAATDAAVTSSRQAAARMPRPPMVSSACTTAPASACPCTGFAGCADELQLERGRRLGQARTTDGRPAEEVVHVVVGLGPADPGRPAALRNAQLWARPRAGSQWHGGGSPSPARELAVGADAGEFDGVLHRGEPGVRTGPLGPPLHHLGVHRPTAATAAAHQVVAMPVGGPPTVKPLPVPIPYDIDITGRLQIPQRAETKSWQSMRTSRTAVRCRIICSRQLTPLALVWKRYSNVTYVKMKSISYGNSLMFGVMPAAHPPPLR